MSGSLIFLHLAGAVALLLWATRMVRTGIERAYGEFMRQRLCKALGNRIKAAVAGFFLAIALQSATAVALIVSGFVASGYVGGGVGIAALLGADLGSAFVTKLLRHDLPSSSCREKEIVREFVQESEEKHIRRLATGNAASIETSSIHIDTMRDIKEVNSLLVSIAYPVLSQVGLLRANRLL